ncbi:hypothetical protein MAR_038210 [Mya arenaria]|uniref:Uncharacterized protein n=1 Tax=Mya arenaria TaxID=6604 RepID=A0ABY7FUM3_MYAAR|nr:hypothetical protein MAR_038169 [Mya arenaria]WAR24541.1 hypothetical protein MAR_038210 [Mya arenaria]
MLAKTTHLVIQLKGMIYIRTCRISTLG